ncbi:MAG TPA: ECF-type sigma factor [Bryobacteraceae bacterium]|nr:ECF-type sigma factor [Bryobacteraceae bacterium]
MESSPITLRLREFAAGDKSALDQVIPLVYSELRKLANRHLRRERDAHTLQPTALVHEAYVKLIGQDQPDYRSRAHFLGVAARVMRQILIDHARARNTEKRGGGEQRCSLDESIDAAVERPAMLLAVDDALKTLERTDSAKARLIELRFFGGLTAEESAEVMDLPVAKIRAELRLAQAWLQRELDDSSSR